MILKIVNYPLESERETVSEQFQGSWRLGTAQALHAQYKYVSSVDIRHLGTPYERVPRFLSTRELMVGNLRDSEAARYVLLKSVPIVRLIFVNCTTRKLATANGALMSCASVRAFICAPYRSLAPTGSIYISAPVFGQIG